MKAALDTTLVNASDPAPRYAENSVVVVKNLVVLRIVLGKQRSV